MVVDEARGPAVEPSVEAVRDGARIYTRADVEKLLEVIEASAFRSPYYQAKGNAMLAREIVCTVDGPTSLPVSTSRWTRRCSSG